MTIRFRTIFVRNRCSAGDGGGTLLVVHSNLLCQRKMSPTESRWFPELWLAVRKLGWQWGQWGWYNCRRACPWEQRSRSRRGNRNSFTLNKYIFWTETPGFIAATIKFKWQVYSIYFLVAPLSSAYICNQYD
jgi:hypothetical protein